METLKPYLEDGTLKIQSGQDQLHQAATQQWDPATAKARMQNLIAKSYSGGTTLDGVLSPYDGISIGIISALQGAGYGTSDRPLPTITGQDAEAASVKSIIAGQQYSTIYKDTRKLAKQSVTMAEDLLTGKKPEVNDTKSYDNKVKVVPTFLFQPTVVTKDNYKEVLVDSRVLHRSRPEVVRPISRTGGAVPAAHRASSPSPPARPRAHDGKASTWRTPSSRCGTSPRRSPASRPCRTSRSRSSAARSTRSAARTARASPR